MKTHVRSGGTTQFHISSQGEPIQFHISKQEGASGIGNYNTLLNIPIINLLGSSEDGFINLSGVTSPGTYCLKGYYKYTVTSDLYYTKSGILCYVMVDDKYRIIESVILVDGRNTFHKIWYKIDDNSFIKEEFMNLEGVLWSEV